MATRFSLNASQSCIYSYFRKVILSKNWIFFFTFSLFLTQLLDLFTPNHYEEGDIKGGMRRKEGVGRTQRKEGQGERLMLTMCQARCVLFRSALMVIPWLKVINQGNHRAVPRGTYSSTIMALGKQNNAEKKNAGSRSRMLLGFKSQPSTTSLCDLGEAT